MAHILWVTARPGPKLSTSIITGPPYGHVTDHCGAVLQGTPLYLFSGYSLPVETVKKRYSFRSLNNYLNLILDLILEGNSLLLSFHS